MGREFYDARFGRCLEAWWSHVDALDLRSRFPIEAPLAPKLRAWELNVAYVFDPSGVLWHFAEIPPAQAG
jgi:hypothetical protein